MLITRLLPSQAFNHRGSALVGTLVMLGILAMAVSAMLYSANHSIRASRDKLLYEQAYQAAVSGTHVARAWLIDPELASSMTSDNNLKTDLEALTEKACTFNQAIKDSAPNYEAANKSPAQVAEALGGAIGSAFADGRIPVYEFSQNASSKVATFFEAKGTAKPNDKLFNSAGGKPSISIEELRITTLGDKFPSKGSLREATFIIESKGVAEYAGTRKERVVHQRVLIFPQNPESPLIGANESIITQGNYTGQGQSNAHWAPVLALGDIELLGLSLDEDKKKPGVYKLTLSNGTGYNYGGAMASDNTKIGGVDKWLKWMTGPGSEFLSGSDPFFGDKSASISDFYKELYNGLISGMDPNQFSLKNFEVDDILDLAAGDEVGLFEKNEAGDNIAEGSLVQNSEPVKAKIDNFFEQNVDNIDFWRQKAINEYSYIKPKGDTFVAADGLTPLYYDPATGAIVPESAGNIKLDKKGLEKLSMMPLVQDDTSNVVDGAYNVHAQDTKVPDRLLFVDYPDSGEASIDLPSNFFWKGVLYVCGDVNGKGAGGAATVLAKDPTQYDADPFGDTGYPLPKCIMDGIMIVTGEFSGGGNCTIYGTLATKGGVSEGGTPSVYYNTANATGRLQKPSDTVAPFRLLGGQLREENKWIQVVASE